jgi:Uma2 family endonuclease
MAAVLNPSEPTTQKVILHTISWETYERLLAEHQEGSSTRFAYDRGMLEIRILSLGHESFKERLMRLVGVIAEGLEIDIEGVGSTTFRREDLARGFKLDACYYLTKAEYIRHKDDIDLAVDPPPELVIEIDITSPSLNKFPILAAMGVLEVWRFDGAQIGLFRLSEGKYVKVDQSIALPAMTSEVINRLLEASKTLKRTDWLRLVRESVRSGA